MINTASTFLLLRLAIGASMFGHGLVRLPKLNGFSAWMTGQFEKSLLPPALVIPFSYVLPVAEFLIGILLILGLFTRQTLFSGGIVMILLVFGSCLIEEWSAIPSQLIHVFFFAIMLSSLNHNAFSIDALIKK